MKYLEINFVLIGVLNRTAGLLILKRNYHGEPYVQLPGQTKRNDS